MKAVLFCNLPYAFSIFKPLADALLDEKDEILWYLEGDLEKDFPYQDMPFTSDLNKLKEYESDAIFVCGNTIPYWLRGVKVQIFHGLAGEKKGHFRIREYFDLYLTQGPYFTKRFKELSKKYKNFEVVETGWSKLDTLYNLENSTQKREELLKKYQAKKIILYAPTFSPSLTSAQKLFETIKKLSEKEDVLVLVKFHDKMSSQLKEIYHDLQNQNKNIYIAQDSDITLYLQISDIMISDSSSVVYEFILLDKPVVTLNSISENINWFNHSSPKAIYEHTIKLLDGDDKFKQHREKTIQLYHPYKDANSSKRMIEATKNYIKKHGIPTKRSLPLLRKLKLRLIYGF